MRRVRRRASRTSPQRLLGVQTPRRWRSQTSLALCRCAVRRQPPCWRSFPRALPLRAFPDLFLFRRGHQSAQPRGAVQSRRHRRRRRRCQRPSAAVPLARRSWRGPSVAPRPRPRQMPLNIHCNLKEITNLYKFTPMYVHRNFNATTHLYQFASL